MSNSRVSSLIRSSGPSKAGVTKRGRFSDFISIKATAISIFLTSLGIEIVKCSRCQYYRLVYVTNLMTVLSYLEYTKAKKQYDSIGLSIVSASRLVSDIYKAKSERLEAKA